MGFDGTDVNDIDEILHRYFPQLNNSQLREELRQVGSVYTYPAGKDILEYGRFVKMVPLVISGRIKVMRADDSGHEIFLYFLNPGETCTMSFSCCMANKRSEVRTVAEEDSTVIGIPMEYVDRWMTKYAVWKNFVMKSYDDRILELIRTIDSIAFKNMDERLWEYLEMKSRQNANGVINVTHQEIASDLFASREAVSRLLKKLEQDGRISLGRNAIQILKTS